MYSRRHKLYTQGESRLIEQVPGGNQTELGTERQVRVPY